MFIFLKFFMCVLSMTCLPIRFILGGRAVGPGHDPGVIKCCCQSDTIDTWPTSQWGWHTKHFTLHTVLPHCTLHTVHFTLYTSLYTLHTIHFTLYTSHYTLHPIHLTLYTSFYTLYTIYFTLYNSHYTQSHHTTHTIHITLYTSHYIHFTLYTKH